MPSSSSRRRASAPFSSRRQRAWLLLLLPALLVLVMLLCGPAGRAHAAPASDAAGVEKQQPHDELELDSELEGGEMDDGGEPMGEKGGKGKGPGQQQRPTFNFLQARSRAELEAEGFQCFPTGECLECTMEEMVRAVRSVGRSVGAVVKVGVLIELVGDI